jgi:hypothetical protein
MKTSSILAWSLVGLVLGGSVAYGQSLVDIARREEDRRKAVKTPARVYTIQDVQKASGVDPNAPVAAAPAGAATPADAAASPPDAATTAKPAPQPAPEQGAKDEAYWREAFAGARDRLERSTAYMSALKMQYDVIANRFTTLSDLAARGAAIAEMEKVQAQIDRLQLDVEQQTKDLAALEEEARRSHVPPGWIRPPDR